jgi:hypothetical protein
MMLYSTISVAGLALLVLANGAAGSPKPAEPVRRVYTGPTEAIDLPSNVLVRTLDSATTTDRSSGSLSKRDDEDGPNVFVYSSSYNCSGYAVEYYGLPTSGCFKVNTFESFSPASARNCEVRAYTGTTSCSEHGAVFQGWANGECIGLQRKVKGVEQKYNASAISVECY